MSVSRLNAKKFDPYAHLNESNVSDLFRRVFYTLFILLICRIGVHIPLPGVRSDVVLELVRSSGAGLLGMFDMFSGGAVSNMSIMALGLMPYISSSIIVQLFSVVSPYLKDLKKSGGEVGQRKINQYTRYGAVFIGLFQSFAVANGLEVLSSHSGMMAVPYPGFFFKFTSVISLVSGTLFLVWLGERISARGIGNGSSMIIYAGIVSNLPQSAYRTIELGKIGAVSSFIMIAVLVSVIFIILFIVFFEKAIRKVPFFHARHNVQGSVNRSSYIPIKVNMSGVLPPIFAGALLGIPQILIQFFGSSDMWFVSFMLRILSHGHPVFIVLYISLIVFFSFFYAPIIFNTEQIANEMRKSGASIDGMRAGDKTKEYLDHILNRLTFIGAFYISAICIIPELILSIVSLQFYLGGTSMLIIVGVSIEVMTQVASYLLGSKYAHIVNKPWLRN
ncbi:preprotein translocase subunit SecY [Candidatus Gromoviella agglomerans]|uniref:preprotein translocase subunit SecY n=1 Tax=Candidatus Gromoviella agglomerans TaxID=2806609 RepID=UPI001E644CF5|nr:preprotein translocase subunit SecY [Candidatus Gromoviella agglomerans]UFX98578.1 Protein translocase subunit SecY [Candidatus Gromoviella agglomerans]